MRSAGRRSAVGVVLGAMLCALVSVGGLPFWTSSIIDAQSSSPGGSLTPVTPCRLSDTRQVGAGPSAAGASTRLQVSGRCGLPTGGRAVALTVTATDASTAGFVTLSPAGSPRPDTSNLNYRPSSAVANSAVVMLSSDGAIDIYTSSSVHVIVDVSGVFVDARGPVSSGRFVPSSPTRVVDTRSLGNRTAGDLVMPLPEGVAPDATAVAISVTVADASEPVYISLHPNGTARPTTSVVNSEPLERARAVTILAPVTAGGLVIHRSAPSNVIIDLIGWFTGPSAPASTDGLFVARQPTRVWDSRASADPIHAGGTVERQLIAQPATAVLANVTAVGTTTPGYLTAFPAGTPRPNVSMLNATWRDPVAGMTIVSTSTQGVDFHASAGMHVLVDVAGHFTGSPSIPTTATLDRMSSNQMAPTGGSVLFVSDSSLAGIRWSGQLGALQGASILADLESCRRLSGASCRGREGYAPSTATTAVSMAPGRIDTLVVAVGYNDHSATFRSGFDAVISAARARGIPRVVWMTYRQSVGYQSPEQASRPRTTVRTTRSCRRSSPAAGTPKSSWRTGIRTRRRNRPG